MANGTPTNGRRNGGFAIRSLSDVVAFATLLALFLGVCAWGLKLEGRNDAHNLRISNLESRVADGILPRAEERIDHHTVELEELRRRIERLEEARGQ